MSTDTGNEILAEHTPPGLVRDWRFYTGMAALIVSLVMPAFAFLVPLLELPAAQSVVIVGLLIAGGPEIIGLIGIALLGRNAFQYFTYQAKRAFRSAVLATRVSKKRYYIGLSINMMSWIPLYLFGYFQTWLPSGDARIYILASAGLCFILSMFIMGGEFWEKFRRLFIWEGKP